MITRQTLFPGYSDKEIDDWLGSSGTVFNLPGAFVPAGIRVAAYARRRKENDRKKKMCRLPIRGENGSQWGYVRMRSTDTCRGHIPHILRTFSRRARGNPAGTALPVLFPGLAHRYRPERAPVVFSENH